MKLAAVVVNHNGARFLPRCLGSLAGLVDTDQEVVLVDNASTDDSLELVRRDFSFVRVLARAENLGFGAAVNLAAAATRGEALLLVNPDAWLVGDCARLLAAALAGDDWLGSVAPRFQYPDGSPQLGWAPDRGLLGEALQKVRNPLERWPFVLRPLDLLARAALGPGWLTAACLLVRRSAFAQVGGFDPGYFLYFEDADLGLRLRRAGWTAAVVDRAHAVHVGGGGAPLSAAAMLHYRRSQVRYYRQHRPGWEVNTLLRHLRRKYRSGPIADWLRQGEPG